MFNFYIIEFGNTFLIVIVYFISNYGNVAEDGVCRDELRHKSHLKLSAVMKLSG